MSRFQRPDKERIVDTARYEAQIAVMQLVKHYGLPEWDAEAFNQRICNLFASMDLHAKRLKFVK